MRGGFNAILRIACPYATPQSPNRDGLPRSIKELEYSLTLRTLDTYAANIVVISRYQYVRLLPARVVSAYAAPTVFAIFSSCFYRASTQAQTLKNPARVVSVLTQHQLCLPSSHHAAIALSRSLSI